MSFNEKQNGVRSDTNLLNETAEVNAIAPSTTINAQAQELYAEALSKLSEAEIEAEERRVTRKLDMRILPIICVCYTLQFLDKLSLNYALAYSFKEDLGLVGQRYSWVASIFNFGYLFWAFPSNWILQRVPVGRYTGVMIFCWSILLIGHIGATNYGGILVLRFLLGMFEASILPLCMMICAMFYTKKEQPLRMCIFLLFNGVATMVGLLLLYGLGHAHLSMKTWRLIFMVIGLMNFVWAFVVYFFVPDSPHTARFLTHHEKMVLMSKIARNNQGLKDSKFRKSHVIEGILDPKVWLLAFIGLGCGVINGGSSNFTLALLKGFGFTGLSLTILQLPTGAIEFAVVATAGFIAIFVKNMRCIIFVLLCVPGTAGLIGIHVIPLHHKWPLVGCTWLLFIIGGPVILSWILINANIAGATKKTFTLGCWFAFYAAGNIVGPNIFYTDQAPKYHSAIIGQLVCYCVMMAMGIALRCWMQYCNYKRDQAIGGEFTEEMAEQAVANGFNDMTDGENKGFRYSL